jgi:hypothetical protein
MSKPDPHLTTTVHVFSAVVMDQSRFIHPEMYRGSQSNVFGRRWDHIWMNDVSMLSAHSFHVDVDHHDRAWAALLANLPGPFELLEVSQ